MGLSKVLLLGAALLAVPLAGGPAAAQSKKVVPGGGGGSTQAAASDLDRIAGILQDMGYRAVPDSTSSPPSIQSKFGGITTLIQLANCDEGTAQNCNIMRFHSGFDLEAGLDPKTVNTWNSDKYFGRAYLDDENDPHIDLVVSMVGITDENIKGVVEWWDWAIGAFKDHINW
jgi:hypothetical protein